MKRMGLVLAIFSVSLGLMMVLTAHKAAAYAITQCDVLGNPANTSSPGPNPDDLTNKINGYYPDDCLPGQSDSNLGNLSGSSVAGQFISDIEADANSPYPVNRAGAAYIEAHLQAKGGTWTSNLTQSGVTVSTGQMSEYLTKAQQCENTGYYPPTNSVQPNTDCQSDTAVFVRQNGQIVFVVRIQCGNVIGNFPGPTDLPPPYNLDPSVKATVNTGAAVAYIGDVITFTYKVANTLSGNSDGTTCTTYANEYTGNRAAPGAPYDQTGTTVTICSGRVFGGNSTTTITTDTVTATAADAGRTICRTLYVAPSNPAGDRAGAEACVYVETFNLVPKVNAAVNTGAAVAYVGDKVTFTYTVANTDDGHSDGTTCTTYANEYTGNRAAPGAPYDQTGTTAAVCAGRVFDGDSTTTVGTVSVTAAVADAGRTICRTLYVAPSNPAGDRAGAEACVYVETFNLVPKVKDVTSTGTTDAYPGGTITFTYTVENTDTGHSDDTTCTEYQNEYTGTHVAPGAAPYDEGGTTSAACNKEVFGGNTTTTIKTEVVDVTTAEVYHTICRTLIVTPVTPAGTSAGAEDCVYVTTFALVPTINETSSEGDTAYVQVGDTVTFTYAIANTASGTSFPATCDQYDRQATGYYTAPNLPAYDATGATTVDCSNQKFQGDQTVTVKTETITITSAMSDTTQCRTLTVTPSSPTAGIVGTESCIYVVNEPYSKVFGGDVSAGNAQASSTCTTGNDYNAGIVGWNTSTGLYDGAGTQLAAFAIGDIDDFVSAQTATGGTRAVAPSGLSFANNPITTGTYGGNLGTGSLPCMNDYYNIPTGAQLLPGNDVNLATLGSGSYYYTSGPVTLYGTLPSAADGGTTARIQIFVDGNSVYIPSSITYQTGWQSVSDIPMLELVVQSGNIYVSNNATELDGTYIAQNSAPDGKGTGGQIATCATAGGPIPTGVSGAATSSLPSSCNNQLVVNGAFVADDVELNRTDNTLSDSGGDNPANLTSSAAEQFDYSPSVWLVQPPTTPEALTYNTIVDLPPVL